MRVVLAFVAAVNPAAVAVSVGARRPPTVTAVAAAITLALAVLGAGLSDGVLEALDVTPETFRVAAAVVLGLTGARWLVIGPRPVTIEPAPEGWRAVGVPLLIPVLVTPALAAVAISAGADDGVGVAAIGAAVALALAFGALLPPLAGPRLAWAVASRFVGALGVAVAFALAVDGVRSV